MKFALALNGNEIAAHFGHCEKYLVVDAENGKEISKKEVENPGHRPGFLPKFLAEKGVECIIAGGIGMRAQNLFSEHGINVIPGVQGTSDVIIDAFLSNKLEAGQNLCDH